MQLRKLLFITFISFFIGCFLGCKPETDSEYDEEEYEQEKREYPQATVIPFDESKGDIIVKNGQYELNESGSSSAKKDKKVAEANKKEEKAISNNDKVSFDTKKPSSTDQKVASASKVKPSSTTAKKETVTTKTATSISKTTGTTSKTASHTTQKDTSLFNNVKDKKEGAVEKVDVLAKNEKDVLDARNEDEKQNEKLDFVEQNEVVEGAEIVVAVKDSVDAFISKTEELVINEEEGIIDGIVETLDSDSIVAEKEVLGDIAAETLDAEVVSDDPKDNAMQTESNADVTELTEEKEEVLHSWYLSVALGTQVFNGVDDHKLSFTDRIAPTLNLSFGRNMTGWLSVDANLSLTQFKGLYNTPKEDKHFTTNEKNDIDGMRFRNQKGWYTQFQIDAKFDLNNVFFGYKQYRKNHVMPYVGAGFASGLNSKDACFAPIVDCGIQYQYTISNSVSLFGDAHNAFVSKTLENETCGHHSMHNAFGLSLGVKYSFNK